MKPTQVTMYLQDKFGRIRISPTTLKHWEDYGLIKDVGLTASGRRDFTEENVARLEMITFLKAIKISTEDIIRFLDGDERVRELVFETVKMYDEKILPYGRVMFPSSINESYSI